MLNKTLKHNASVKACPVESNRPGTLTYAKIMNSAYDSRMIIPQIIFEAQCQCQRMSGRVKQTSGTLTYANETISGLACHRGRASKEISCRMNSCVINAASHKQYTRINSSATAGLGGTRRQLLCLTTPTMGGEGRWNGDVKITRATRTRM